MIKVAITGGYGKAAPGRSPDGEYLEADWNGRRAKLLLDAINGIGGMEARTFDDPSERNLPLSALMNAVNAYRPKVFLDLRSAASGPVWADNARGVTVFCRVGDTDSHAFGDIIGRALCAATGLHWRGVGEANRERIFGGRLMPWRNRTPLSLLIEWGFHTSRPDLEIMTDPELNEKGAAAIANAAWAAFNNAAKPEDRKMLRRGDSGDDVKTLQAALRSNGFNPGPIDGLFGPRTESAARSFQKLYLGPNAVDGVVGPNTWAALLP